MQNAKPKKSVLERRNYHRNEAIRACQRALKHLTEASTNIGSAKAYGVFGRQYDTTLPNRTTAEFHKLQDIVQGVFREMFLYQGELASTSVPRRKKRKA